MASKNDGRLHGKVALITGGASGIGLAIALAYLTEGANVYVVDYSPQNIKSARELFSSRGFMSTSYAFKHADAADEDSVRSFVEESIEKFAALDIAVLNAGIGQSQTTILDSSVEEWDAVMRINARGAYLGVKYTIQKLKALGRGGSIIIAASIASQVATPGLCAYTMSKYAARALAMTAASECVGDGIRVNSVSPGLIDTDMARNLKDLNDRARAIPLKRIATTAEVAQVFLFLASDDASYVTGADYRVDGGALSH